MEIRKEIQVSGIVQGVGFRPYVYRLARDHQLAGLICNTASGSTIEVQGPSERVEAFVTRLPQEAPALCRITGLRSRDLPCKAGREFRIGSSSKTDPASALISPDVAVCDLCLQELFDPADRRYRYPFINCTNCGPRFTIIRDIPYDRPRTSMAAFGMCAACQAEYDEPANRRFHAQPNACWKCGPQVELWAREGKRIETSEPVAEAAARLGSGCIVAVKGLGGFHLAVDATNAAAVKLLRERKGRIEKPFAVMAPSLKAATTLCEIGEEAAEILASKERPIVLLPWKMPSFIAPDVAPFQRYLGVFLPYTPLHYLLFAAGGFAALVMTSGNLSEEPIAIENQEAMARLAGIADYFLVHNREILLRCDDSVVRPAGGRLRQARRSRGYVPAPIRLREELPPALGVGGELKNTICLTRGNEAFLSQHIGDLENVEGFAFFQEAVEHLERVLEIHPQAVAYDLHPDYFSTRWALAQTRGLRQVATQHHHAHIASCMAENQIDGKVIGISLDGAGYGSDGHIWGGEVLLADYRGFRRAAHLGYAPMPGGAAAIREPWRMAVGYLGMHYGAGLLRMDIPFVRRLAPRKLGILLRMIERRVNCPLTSSCGRLFDAVAALMGLREQVNYEAQAAIELEMAAADSIDSGAYPLELRREGGCWQIGTRPLFDAIIEDLARGVPNGAISRRFHNGIVETFARMAALLREVTLLDRVCLSGGVFQNVLVLEQLTHRLQEAGLEVFTHADVPTGDGGLSLGQAVIAAHAIP